MSAERSLGCPACGARFRGTAACSRCGADLSILMAIAASAFLRRREARLLLLAGDVERALTRAREAQDLLATGAGEALLRVASCLGAIAARPGA